MISAGRSSDAVRSRARFAQRLDPALSGETLWLMQGEVGWKAVPFRRTTNGECKSNHRSDGGPDRPTSHSLPTS